MRPFTQDDRWEKWKRSQEEVAYKTEKFAKNANMNVSDFGLLKIKAPSMYYELFFGLTKVKDLVNN